MPNHAHNPQNNIANGPDVIRARKVSNWCRRARQLSSDPDLSIDLGNRALGSLNDFLKETATARLTLTRPMSKQVSALKKLFEPLEDEIKETRRSLSKHLIAITPQPREPENSHCSQEQQTQSASSVTQPGQPGPREGKTRPEFMKTPVEIDMTTLDFDSLRPYFTDHAIKNAVLKYTQDTDCHDLRGVTYRSLSPNSVVDIKIERAESAP